jgi:hypothetical protein
MSNPPICFGKWITQSANTCEQCSVQLECYNKMRDNEKKREEPEFLRQTQLCTRDNDDAVENAYGTCEKCG